MNEEKFKTVIRKVEGLWFAGYKGEDTMFLFIMEGETKDKLIHNLANKCLNMHFHKGSL